MRYLVDAKVIVNSNGLTTPGLNETEMPLSPVPLRLLNYLISHNEQLVTREELYQHIWESHGLIPSGPGLAKQISYLRKCLSDYGLSSEIILTKPKQGIVFSASVEVLEDSEYTPEPVAQKRTFVSKTRVLVASGVVLLIFSLFFIGREYIDRKDNQPLAAGSVEGCNIYTWDDNRSAQIISYYLMKAREFIKKNGIKCNQGDEIVVQIQQPEFESQMNVYESKQFFAHCSVMKQDYVCNNTYYSAGKK
ncbi:winged helix-turn-helix domain-containing protein [Cedecea sp. NFIX57]|jgi:DNA-binding winged helix-turn-helix (wHTH) protein|uniref:winged helix-turn-helix domain-containing protein n=1 Tax=Cedecea sp. NFIX57 TaxID=1566286 RepID=UPI000A0AE658|nr:winged helix-turn-helix domain-containing protein [Cedecea sp. NFIX57]SMG61534.1 DNA-binding winged helix-turn-helix (wHTH) domain-containing protein [Cedecea sp. NFIX57]